MSETSVVRDFNGNMADDIKICFMLGPAAYETSFKDRLGDTQALGAEPAFQESNLFLPAKIASVCSFAFAQLDEGDLRRDAWIKRT